MGMYIYNDAGFGDIKILTRQGMRSIKAGWKNGILEVHIPEGTSMHQLQQSLDEMRPKLSDLKEKQKKPITYSIGQVIECFGVKVTIGRHQGKRNVMAYGGREEEMYVNIPLSSDISSVVVNNTISKCLKEVVTSKAADVLIPYAESVAADLNLQPHHFVIGRGFRKLGHCTLGRVIQLSCNLMFYPEPLVRYVVCHELAHLTQMNHSAAFHALCNEYCAGKERELNKQLKRFVLPLRR